MVQSDFLRFTSRSGSQYSGAFHICSTLHHTDAVTMAPNDTTPSTAAVGFRGPMFCSQDPAMWFAVLECNFLASNITKDLTKFTHAVALIPPDVLTQVSDVISAAINSSTPYEDLKAACLSRLQSSTAARLQELLSKEELGNEKPSNLLLRMKKLLGDRYSAFDKDIFKQLYYQRLPAAIQTNLFSVKDKLDLDELAHLADEFMSTMPTATASVSAVAAHAADDLRSMIAKLTLEVDSLRNELRSRSKSRPRGYFRSRSRSSKRRTGASDADGLCYFHKKFGDKAFRCQQPCNFPSSPAPASASLNKTGGHYWRIVSA